jgi:PAS domain-containing protein
MEQNVLMIDPDENYSMQMRALIGDVRFASINLECVPSVSKGLARISKGGIDALLLSLPKESTEQTFQSAFKSDVQASDLPVIVLTESEDTDFNIEMIKHGVHDCLPKQQLNIKSLVKSLHIAMERQKSIKEMQGSHKMLKSMQRLMSDFVENTSDGVLIVDLDGQVRFINSNVETLLGISAENLLGDEFPYPLEKGETTTIDLSKRNNTDQFLEVSVVDTIWGSSDAYMVFIKPADSYGKTESVHKVS